MYILTASQMRAAEESAVKKGMTYERLMENAGSSAARILDKKLKEKGLSAEETRVTVVCGKSNNGGDGFVIARKLCEKGYAVKVVLAMGRPVTVSSQKMFEKLEDTLVQMSEFDYTSARSDFDITSADVLVDTVFGTGFSGKAGEELSFLFNTMNSCDGFKVAIDIPSGIPSDSGEVSGTCFRADFTIAIHTVKPAHVLKEAALYCGEVTVEKIGIPDICFEDEYPLYTCSENEIAENFTERNLVSHKGDYGRVLCVCGSKMYQGASYLSTMGAVRSGAGLVFSAFPESAYSAIAPKLIDSPLLPMPSNSQGMFSSAAIPKLLDEVKKSDAVVLGCGIGQCAETEEIVKEILLNAECPVVLDADGINLICDNIDILKAVKSDVILTPHPGEMSRLTGISVKDINLNRVKTAKAFSEYFGVTLVLKGANTVVARPNTNSVYINPTGNTALSKGGSGDVLSGIIGGFLAQGIDNAAISGVYVHGLAAEKASEKYSQRGVTQSECLTELAKLLSIFE